MKALKYIAIFTACMTGLSSCGNNFLDNSPSTGLGDHELVSSLTDLDNVTNGCYNYLKASSGAYDYYYTSYYMLSGDMMGDDFRTTRNWMDDYYAYKRNPADITTVIYRNVYSMSNQINITLKAAESLEESVQKDELLAELHVLRALGHWDIARLYSPLPSNLGHGNISADALGIRILDEVVEDFSQPAYRDKAKDVYAFIQTELETWVPKMSKRKQNGRLNYYGGQAFMARFYLFMENWDGALAAAKEVIGSGQYTLYTRDKYEEVWQQAFTSESIFELYTDDSESNQWVSLGTLIGGTRYQQVGATYSFEKILAQAEAEGDIRTSFYVQSTSFPEYRYPRKKYDGRGGNELVCNPKVFRLSEMYLIAAEGELMANSDPVAAGKWLSDLREKRVTVDMRKYDSGADIEDILYERRLELACEGHRAWDLWRLRREVVRWRTPEEKQASGHLDALGVIPYDHYRRIWPIPEREILLLPAADRAAQQNPGYGA